MSLWRQKPTGRARGLIRRRPGDAAATVLQNEFFGVASGGALDGTVANASSATTLTTVAGTQTHQGAVANAASATATSAPAGTQSHAGAVSNAATATALSTVAGSQALQGVVSNAASATSESTPIGTQEHQGTAANAASATAAGTAEGTQSHQGAVSAAGTATALSTPAGTLEEPGGPNVAGATSGTELSSVAGQYVPPAGTQETVTGGWPYFDKPRKKKREQWREELNALFAKPAPVEIEQAVEKPRTVYVPDIGRAGQKYIDALLASIATAQQEQQRAQQQAALATAERKADEAQARLAQAIEAEQIARRQMRQFDIAFVAAVLADL